MRRQKKAIFTSKRTRAFARLSKNSRAEISLTPMEGHFANTYARPRMPPPAPRAEAPPESAALTREQRRAAFMLLEQGLLEGGRTLMSGRLRERLVSLQKS